MKTSTLRRDSRWLFSLHFQRWMLLKERLASYGYPAFASLAEAASVRSFALTHEFTSRRAVYMLGDSMVPGCIGIALAAALASIEFVE